MFAESCKDLLNGMLCLESYCLIEWFNCERRKNKSIVFRRGGRALKEDKLNYNGNEIDFVCKFKYLGTVLTSNVKFAITKKAFSEQASRAAFGIKQYLIDYLTLNITTLIRFGRNSGLSTETDPVEDNCD